jgi:hypothetical protein
MNRSRILPALTALALLSATPAAAHAADQAHTLAAGKFTAARPGEALLDLTAEGRDSDWGTPGHEAAVVTVWLDGAYAEDVVLHQGDRPFGYRVALGHVAAGEHRLRVTFSEAKSAPAVHGARVTGLAPRVVADDDPQAEVLRHAPILYGRDLPEIPGRYENSQTDTPLVAYHTTVTDPATGDRTIEYTMIWSNEDGGTNTPALMARWGRTTDIEWIYRVVLDPQGRVLSEVYQAPNHATLPFTGAKEGDHPLLVTATANNNTDAVTDPSKSTGYRFFLDSSQALPDGRAREAIMDANPWTYQIMAKEMVREGKVEQPASTATPEMSDQRDYLFAELAKTTTYPVAPAPGTWVGTALAVRLKGADTWYTSHHGVADWSIQRDIPAATTVELPEGATAADVQAVKAIAVPVARGGTTPGPAPSDYRIDVRAINRGFLLQDSYLPGASFVSWQGDVVLDPAHPEAIVWQAGAQA